MNADVVIVGHIGRDLVVLVDELPGPNSGTPVRDRREMLGGKGANQAVGLAQLGVTVGLVGAVGDDAHGAVLLEAAAADGIAVDGVTTRAGMTTSLIVSVVDRTGAWRYFEHRPEGSFVRVADVRRHAAAIRSARAVALQLQEPWPAIAEAASIAHAGGALVALDGAPPDGVDPDPVLALTTLVRADQHEAGLLVGHPVNGPEEAVDAGRRLLERGPRVVVLAAGPAGNVVVWPAGAAVVPLVGGPGVDPTGGGDALLVGTIAGLLGDPDPVAAVALGTVAAGSVVGRLGGRPALARAEIEGRVPDLLRSIRPEPAPG